MLKSKSGPPRQTSGAGAAGGDTREMRLAGGRNHNCTRVVRIEELRNAQAERGWADHDCFCWL